MCKEVGFKVKSSYCFCVICVFVLFNVGVEEKLIRDCIGYRLNVLFKYEKVSEMKFIEVLDILVLKCSFISNVFLSNEVLEIVVEVGSLVSIC